MALHWRALTAIETTGERLCEAEVNRVAGEIALQSPEPEKAKAEEYFDRALEVARKQQAKSWELRAAMSMARLGRDQGKRDEARELLAPVYGWFAEGFGGGTVEGRIGSALPPRRLWQYPLASFLPSANCYRSLRPRPNPLRN